MAVEKNLPAQLEDNKRYIIRARSINPFGIASEWSEALVFDASEVMPTSDSPLTITKDSIYAYGSDGQMTLGFFGGDQNRTNLVPNPSFETNTTGWEANDALVSIDTFDISSLQVDSADFYSKRPAGTECLELTKLSSSTIVNPGLSQTSEMSVTPGEKYTASCYVDFTYYSPTTSTPDFDIDYELDLELIINFYDVSDQLIHSVSPSTPVLFDQESQLNGWKRMSLVGIEAPEDASYAKLEVISPNYWDFNVSIFLDGFLFEEVDILKDYFDGDTSELTSWVGTAHTSTSTMTVGSGDLYIRGNIAGGTIDIGGSDATSFHVDEDGNMWLGASTYASAPFKVSSAGAVTASGATITGASTFSGSLSGATGTFAGSLSAATGSFSGSITATSGSIGGFALSSTTLSASNLSLTNTGNITVGTGDNVARLSSSGSYRLWVGDATSTSAPFRVTQAGAVTMTNATISGGSFNIGNIFIADASVGIITCSSSLQLTSSGSNISVRGATSATFSGGSGHLVIYTGENNDAANVYLRKIISGSIISSEVRLTSNSILLSTGEVDINADADISGRLDLHGLLATYSPIYVVGNGSYTNSGAGNIRNTCSPSITGMTTSTNTNSTSYHLSFFVGSTAVGSITSTSGTTSFNTTSDYRRKKDITNITGSIDRIKSLRPVNFKWKSTEDQLFDDTLVKGFIAHEAQPHYPEAVTGTRDEVDKDGNPVYQAMDVSKMMPDVVATLKELITRVEALEAV